ncbi:radical SAM protein, partial [Candidatus Falkowbacteria bacterium]|nr:radical SAM protein [Candidatus Falkowbacteria bacterium]
MAFFFLLKKYLNPASTSLKKMSNFLLALFEWKIAKKSRLKSYPLNLTICSGNICNLSCSLCPVGQNASGREKGFMKFETLKKIIDECGAYLYHIDLFNWGEPLLNPEIFKMIRYAKDHKIDVAISSNLNHFNDKICENIITSGLDTLIISLDGGSQESSEKYQKHNNFSNVIENIKKIVQKKQELKKNTPFIQWRFLVNSYNYHEIPKARKLAHQLKINKLELAPFRCDMGQELFLKDKSQIENVKSWLPPEESFSMYNY